MRKAVAGRPDQRLALENVVLGHHEDEEIQAGHYENSARPTDKDRRVGTRKNGGDHTGHAARYQPARSNPSCGPRPGPGEGQH